MGFIQDANNALRPCARVGLLYFLKVNSNCPTLQYVKFCIILFLFAQNLGKFIVTYIF